MKHLVTSLCIVIASQVFAQNGKEIIMTDSTETEIIRNSVYIVSEENYRFKDSILYTVRYRADTTQICHKGWKNRRGDYFGKWSEFKLDGTWLKTIDYDNDTWEYNPIEYPFQNYLNEAKKITDRIVIEKYGLNFFKENIKFKFHGDIRGKTAFAGWTEPMKEKPLVFHVYYTIEIKDNQFFYDELDIEIDSIGNISKNTNTSQISFIDRIKGQTDTFMLTYKKAIDICKSNGLIISDTIKFETDFQFVFWKKHRFTGKFVYTVRQHQKTKVLQGLCPMDCKTETIYREWIIDPWTAELIENKKYRRIDSWSHGCGTGESYEILD